ncbi:NUDIX hydrolase [Nocardioides sp. 616]|uniref:NUDIX hydrolase n=1 Tax=Nocardioides sp. 616 TaxID=2268090 RepID=UPI001F063176|nr:NUDIX hydrolase [Nocardioides sp. 616]
MPSSQVVAAGGVVLRKARRGGGHEVLLVHRPRYDDWSLPKGKLDPGEHVTACAIREVAEETGLRIRLGPPLPDQHYRVAAGLKTVHWWVARVVGDDDVSSYLPNAEIDAVQWLAWGKAVKRLTREQDRATLAAARPLRRRTRALAVVRHAAARPRRGWQGDDRRRPLSPDGEAQARRLVPVLAAYDVSLLVSSSSTRCVQTLAPYARATWSQVTERDGLSEEDASAEGIAAIAAGLLDAPESAVLCTHRPVLPQVLAALGLPEHKLEPAGMVVLHHRRGRVLAVEEHRAP